MRMFGAVLIASVCAIGAAAPARAIEELKNCDDIKDAGSRMACLQAHISHLEETLLSLSGEVVDLRHALNETLRAGAVYKLQYVGGGGCLGFAAPDQPPVIATCDRPDSWKLVLGAQTPAAPRTAPKAATPGPAPPPAAATKAPKPPKAPKAAAGTTVPNATTVPKPAATSTTPKTAAPGQ